MLKSQEEALIAQQAAEFQAWLKSQPWWPHEPTQAGFSGPLPQVDFPPEMVDEMEAAIEEAFEKVEPDDDAITQAFDLFQLLNSVYSWESSLIAICG